MTKLEPDFWVSAYLNWPSPPPVSKSKVPGVLRDCTHGKFDCVGRESSQNCLGKGFVIVALRSSFSVCYLVRERQLESHCPWQSIKACMFMDLIEFIFLVCEECSQYSKNMISSCPLTNLKQVCNFFTVSWLFSSRLEGVGEEYASSHRTWPHTEKTPETIRAQIRASFCPHWMHPCNLSQPHNQVIRFLTRRYRSEAKSLNFD